MERSSVQICNANCSSCRTPYQTGMQKSQRKIINFTSKTLDQSTELSLKYPKSNPSNKAWFWKWDPSNSKFVKLTSLEKHLRWVCSIRCSEKLFLLMILVKKLLTALDVSNPTILTMRISTWVESMLKSIFLMANFMLKIWNQPMGTSENLHRTWMRLSKSYDQSCSWLLSH